MGDIKTDIEFTILGGGIAGLSVALALHNIGIKALIFEATDKIRPIGTGLGLSANAMKAFDHLGISEDVIKVSNQLSQFSIYNDRGRSITRTDFSELDKVYGISNFAVHRASLQEVLMSKLNPALLVLGKRSVSYMKNGDGYEINFEDGTKHCTRYLIVAEGINSPIRKQLMPDVRPRYAGYTCWRGLSSNTGLHVSHSFETWGTKGRFGAVPLPGDVVYWFACVNAPEHSKYYKAFSNLDIFEIFKDFHEPVGKIIRGTPVETLIWSDIFDIDPIRKFAFDDVVLVGDAAHATTPNLGQGACQAIEDAVVLGQEMQKGGTMSDAFKRYEIRRRPRTRYVVQQSRKVGKIAQTENKYLAAIRNQIFRLIPSTIGDAQLHKIYRTDF